MTLPGVVFFPHAMLPLHIFEPRYRRMVLDVLDGERMFCVTGKDEQLAAETDQFEPAHEVGSLGVIRACQLNPDGTSNLILQGLVRIKIEDVVQETPYRKIRFSVLHSTADAEDPGLNRQRNRILGLVRTFHRLGGDVPDGAIEFLQALKNVDGFIDSAIYNLCEDEPLKQALLETLDLNQRYQRFIQHLRTRNQALSIEHDLKGKLDDDDIGKN